MIAFDKVNAKVITWLNKAISDPSLRGAIADAIAASVNEQLPAHTRRASPSHESIALTASGFTNLGVQLQEKMLVTARGHFDQCQFSSVDGCLSYFSTEDILNVPHVAELIFDPAVLRIAQAFLGAPAIVTDVMAWWSFPNLGVPNGMQRFHRDRGGFRTCKLFLYLTDVAMVDGPHEYILSSANLAHTYAWLKQRGYDDQFAARTFEGSAQAVSNEVAEAFGERVVTVTGAAGTAFMTDNYGLHRGRPTLPGGKRLLAEALYCATVLPERTGRVVCKSRRSLLDRIQSDDLALHAAQAIRD